VSDKPVIKIGLIGFGVVGQGVLKHFNRNRIPLEARLGAGLVIHSIAVRDLKKKRAVQLSATQSTDDAMALATDPEIDIVCELMGGTDLAKKLTLAALKEGKIVVSANKALICECGEEIFRAARKNGGHFFFEASVGGGIPIIKVIREGLVANRFKLIYGILNGTCNYILSRMENERRPLEEIVEEARQLGYMEADESLDLDGWDTAHKAVILAFLAHGKWMPLKDVPVTGIRHITLEDIRWADELGYKIKLLGIITRDFKTRRVFVRVRPTLILRRKLLAGVDDAFNAVSLTGDVAGTTVLIGRGAGQDATASAVISDITDAVTALLGVPPPKFSEADMESYEKIGKRSRIASLEEAIGEYYLRLLVVDQPGVLAELTSIMARHCISVASMLQQPAKDKNISNVVLTTHLCNERRIQDAVHDLNAHEHVLEAPLLLHIANFED